MNAAQEFTHGSCAHKFTKRKSRAGGEGWYVNLGNGIWVSYGWRYSSNGGSFSANRSAHSSVYVQVERYDNTGALVSTEDVHYERISTSWGETYARARSSASEALAHARAKARELVREFSSNKTSTPE